MIDKKRKNKTDRGATGASPSRGNPMDLGLLEQMVKLMAANDLNTLDVRDGVRRVVLKRGPAVAAMAPTAPMGWSGGFAAPAPAAAAPAGPVAAVDEEAGLSPIKSPMVGTFYSAASPDAKPFVAVGSEVDEDSDVCVIEAMKVFNNIKAECRGTIAKVLVSNGQPVEFGQTLFLVKSN